MANVLVIGGAGFLGSHFVPLAVERGHSVTVQDILPKETAKKKLPWADVKYVWKSLLDITSEDVEGYEYVINLAAQADVPLAISSPRWTTTQNVDGCLALLEALRNAKTNPKPKTLFMSSENVYGIVHHSELPITENLRLRPVNTYGATKVAIEGFCHAYHSSFGLPIVIIRSTTMFGEGSRLGQVIPIFIRQALNDQDITIEGDGSQTRDFTYVKNTCEGISKVLESKYEWGIWNIGSGREVTIMDLAGMICYLTRTKSKIVNVPWRSGEEGLRLWVSIEKARSELGYEPKTTLRGGMERTIEWFRELGQAG